MIRYHQSTSRSWRLESHRNRYQSGALPGYVDEGLYVTCYLLLYRRSIRRDPTCHREARFPKRHNVIIYMRQLYPHIACCRHGQSEHVATPYTWPVIMTIDPKGRIPKTPGIISNGTTR